MNLQEYIGDTKTDSLPPGFLKAMKIKYRHEKSKVFLGVEDKVQHTGEKENREVEVLQNKKTCNESVSPEQQRRRSFPVRIPVKIVL